MPPDDERVRALNGAAVRGKGSCVLYWMVAARRTRWNRALSRALAHAREFGRPLVVLEGLRCDYPWANDRIHRFVIDGMADNAARFAAAGVAYVPYVEQVPRAGRGLVEALAEKACVVVTDDHPGFFLPRMLKAAGKRSTVRLEAVDGNGLLPLSASPAAFASVQSFRNFLHSRLPGHAFAGIEEDPLAKAPRRDPPAWLKDIQNRWRPARLALLAGDRELLTRLPVDHGVPPVAERGGPEAAGTRLREFLKDGLARYGVRTPGGPLPVSSGLSPYLHFGHVAAEEIAHAVLLREGRVASRDLVPGRAASEGGFWRVSPPADAFLDELVTWRELAFHLARHRGKDLGRYEAIPGWARATLDRHANDPRPRLFDFATLERAGTDDEVWNAAQRQLLLEGRIHPYLRMLWGKRVLEWTRSPREAFDVLVQLNNRWALDGRDPASSLGILWTFGLYDRPFGPERPVTGLVRAMTSESARRKFDLAPYLSRFGPLPAPNSGG